ncbi:glycoside hydrolase family 3 N-terminal domain-containing protein [Parabacteroides goldsteinii]
MDINRPVEERVEALLKQMTLTEKIGQMDMVSEWDKDAIIKNGYYDFGAWIAGMEPEETNKIQALSEKTRLKIPYLIGMDAAHGYGTLSGRTIFPTSISMAATFNRNLVKKAAKTAAGEIRSAGTHWTFAPCVDIVYDARWGRTGETYGEDPYLSSELVKQAIRGLQENADPQKRVAASMKHLAAGGASVGGVNHASADISERSLRSYILPPFKAGIEAGCMTIMPGHNDIGGIPAHASKWLLTDIVKNEFGFKGFYVSDMMDMDNLKTLHFTAENQKDALRQSVNAGMDMHMYSPDTTQFIVPLTQLVQEGIVPIKRIDDAVRRILKIKFELGLFENRYIDPDKDIYATAENRSLSLEAARECIVLLKNENNLLPIDVQKYKRILVTGPNADNQSILGDWSFFQPDSNVTTVLKGIREVAPGIEVVYSNSGRIKAKISKEKTNTTDPALQKQLLTEGGGISDYSISDAVTKAKSCDLVVVVIGGYGIRSDWGLRTYGESADRPSIDFYGRQVELVQALQKTGKPVVAVIVNGKPLNNEWISQNIPSIIDIWEPGMYGGKALAEILFGQVNPSGKLPITIPKNVGQIPMYYYQSSSRYWTGYGLGSSRSDDQPAYCFGHGLSYTTFEYSDLKLDTVFSLKEDIQLSFKVKNTGNRTGKETPLLFVHDCVSSVVTPVALLKEFTKVELEAGEEKTVHFTVPSSNLGLWNTEMKYTVEPGKFIFKIGRSFNDIRLEQDIFIQ